MPDYIRAHGESAFRDVESAVIAGLSSARGAVIATGGGAVLREENVRSLAENGRIFYLYRDIDKIVPDASRPLSSDRASLLRRFEERREIYERTADEKVDCSGSAVTVAGVTVNIPCNPEN